MGTGFDLATAAGLPDVISALTQQHQRGSQRQGQSVCSKPNKMQTVHRSSFRMSEGLKDLPVAPCKEQKPMQDCMGKAAVRRCILGS